MYVVWPRAFTSAKICTGGLVSSPTAGQDASRPGHLTGSGFPTLDTSSQANCESHRQGRKIWTDF